MLIIDSSLDSEAVGKVIGRFENLIKQYKGTVEKVDKWGKRRLAYPIKGRSDGVYTVLYFRADTALVRELDRILRISDEILRYHIFLRETASASLS
jgi:small subunit ribosomal protein S6